ncbi:MAG: hypothetical protein M3322_09195 [Actinomycetota bacterium]|nr:hypothetical protein [Actinomycetota bacterium]
MGTADSSADFTEAEYRRLLTLALQNYRPIAFPEFRSAGAGSLLWRHDLDFSVHRALALARIEAEEGVRATYFLNLHSAFYNALEAEIADRVSEILALGHDLGVHFDASFYSARDSTPEEALASERRLLESVFDTSVLSFSLHNPETAGWRDDRDDVAGMVNAYGESLRASFAYCSDSNGYWRFRRLRDVLEAAEGERLHVLTHPEWWVPEPMPPRARVARCIDGRAARQHERYDRVLAQMGRRNVGRERL